MRETPATSWITSGRVAVKERRLVPGRVHNAGTQPYTMREIAELDGRWGREGGEGLMVEPNAKEPPTGGSWPKIHGGVDENGRGGTRTPDLYNVSVAL